MATLRVFSPFICTVATFALHCGVLFGQVDSQRRDWRLDQPITARLVDGRRVEGMLDHHSDASGLWLRSELNGAALVSRFPWSQVDEVTQAARRLHREELLGVAREVESKQQDQQAIESGMHSEWLASLQPLRDTAVTLAEDSAAVEPVESLQIEARLANWDADAVVDGLLVTVYPTTAGGNWVPVRGTLDLWLLGEVWPRPEHPHRYPRAGFQELARASHLVKEVDFSRGPATFQLPLRQVHPEAMHSLATYGVVHARLGVNGQGVFEATDPFVRLREASPTRDRLQLFQGQRFFPIERPPRLP